ncbi:histidine kinase [Thermocatellispora tengchongensis]
MAAGAGVVVGWSSVAAHANQPDARPLDWLGWCLLAAASLSVAFLRRRPEAAMVIAVAAAAAYFARGHAYSFWPAPALVAIFAVVARGRRRLGWAGAAVAVAVPGIGVLRENSLDNVVAGLVWALIVILVAQAGEASRVRRAYTAEVERRAEEAERSREEEALRRAQEERLRISRELHDVTSHTVSLIALQAAVAAEAIDREGGPPRAREALSVIRSASREALAEMKAVLGVLHPGAARGPLPGLDRIGELAAAVTEAGVAVTVTMPAPARPLPPAVELAAYRVVQEALTNTVRHAGAKAASVTVRLDGDALAVEVTDDGRGCAEPAGGFGLRGMAERVAALGGSLRVGDAPGGGFRVAARLPLEAAR